MRRIGPENPSGAQSMNTSTHRAAVAATFAATIAVLAGPAAAQGLVGDTLTFNRAYPTPTTPYWTVPMQVTTVAADASDLVDWYSDGTSGFHLTIDPGAESIVFRLISASSFIGLGPQFDGFRVTGFGSDIVSADVAANDSGLSLATSFAGRVLDIDLRGSNFGGSTGFTITVAVPEPGTWAMWLAGTGRGGCLRAPPPLIGAGQALARNPGCDAAPRPGCRRSPPVAVSFRRRRPTAPTSASSPTAA
jgi:hypothetical protein